MYPSPAVDRFKRIAADQNLNLLGFSLAVVAASLLVSPSAGNLKLFGVALPPLCAFRAITGFDCPGCGLTRALVFALHGHLWDSYLMHLWGVPAALIVILQIPYRLYRLLVRQPGQFTWPASWNPWVNRVIILSLLVPWAVKTGWLFYIRFL